MFECKSDIFIYLNSSYSLVTDVVNDRLDLLDTQLIYITLKAFLKELELVYELSGNFMSFLFVIVLGRENLATTIHLALKYSLISISYNLISVSVLFMLCLYFEFQIFPLPFKRHLLDLLAPKVKLKTNTKETQIQAQIEKKQGIIL